MVNIRILMDIFILVLIFFSLYILYIKKNWSSVLGKSLDKLGKILLSLFPHFGPLFVLVYFIQTIPYPDFLHEWFIIESEFVLFASLLIWKTKVLTTEKPLWLFTFSLLLISFFPLSVIFILKEVTPTVVEYGIFGILAIFYGEVMLSTSKRINRDHEK